MSERPMDAPEGMPDACFAELMISLPADWPFSKEAFQREENWWPIRLLKDVARYPHVQNSWVYWGHSWSSVDPPQPFAPNTKMSSAVLFAPKLVAEEGQTIRIGRKEFARLLAVFPIYQDELEVKLGEGIERLIELFGRHGITELLDVKRPSVVPVN
jgi:hypothetical protein